MVAHCCLWISWFLFGAVLPVTLFHARISVEPLQCTWYRWSTEHSTEPNPGEAWETVRGTLYCVLWCILCWTNYETVLLLSTQLFYVHCLETAFFYSEGSDVQFWDVFSKRLLICDEWLCSLCHQPSKWSLGLLFFLYIFICLVKLIQHPGFKYHPYTNNSEVDISNQHFDIANSLRHSSMFSWSGAPEQDPVMFLSFCLYTGPAHFRKNSSASHYLTATILVQVAIIFDLDLRRGRLAGFIASFLASL